VRSPNMIPGSARRIRILFVDDQREVAKTLATLLGRDAVECRFADDGEAGLARLLKEVYDLAVIDLRMPPGQWGGLWLLQELANRGLSVDTLVLSGGAGQSETIEAMRLGADFVVKDKASSELADQVFGALARGAAARSIFAAAQLPTPVAFPYQRMRVPTDPEAQLFASLATAEAALRFCALAGLAVVRANGTQDQSLISRLATPSLGTWRDVCRTLRPQVGDHVLGRWMEAASGREADAVVQHRNDTFHGGGVPTVGVRQALADVSGWVDFFVLAARSGPPIELVVAGSLDFNGLTSSVELARLAGGASAVVWSRRELPAPLVKGRVYLHSTSGEYLDMWPLVLAEQAESKGDWNVSILEGYRKTHGVAAMNDRLRYVNAATGGRFTSSDYVLGDLA
jgi:DNA-binding response OmpR family regulator